MLEGQLGELKAQDQQQKQEYKKLVGSILKANRYLEELNHTLSGEQVLETQAFGR